MACTHWYAQVRHLPAPLVWGSCFLGGCPSPGTYQNGAWWSTPLPWVTDALVATGHADVAAGLVADTIALFQNTSSAVGGVMECVNPQTGDHGVPDYVDSGTNTLAAATALARYRAQSTGAVLL